MFGSAAGSARAKGAAGRPGAGEGEAASVPTSSSVSVSTSPPAAAREPLVTVATLCWNHSYLIRDFLASFLEKTAPGSLAEVQMVVVDNGSIDDTPAILEAWRQEAGGPAWKTVVRSPTNRGFAGGANLAVGEARGRYLLLLNNAVEFKGDLVKA